MKPLVSQVRASALVGLVFAGAACANPASDPELSTDGAAYLATASQKGPVGYRDPAGGVSPDGKWLAYTQGRSVLVQPMEGGGTRVLGPAPSQVRYVTWQPTGELVVHERAFDLAHQTWRVYDVETGEGRSLWPEDAGLTPGPGQLLELSWSPDGAKVAGVTRSGGQSSAWVLNADGTDPEEIASGTRLSYPVFAPDGEVACISRSEGHQYLELPCGSGPAPWMDGQEVYGHVAFDGQGRMVYATPNQDGVLELWSRDVAGGNQRRLAAFSRDAYEPGITSSGQVVFKTQDYRIFLATAPADGGATVPLTTFQSETPSWRPDGQQVAFTFGGWRIATDDINYPDIGQHIGIVDVGDDGPYAEPSVVVRQSSSEDQGMAWSPNQQWIAYHSHLGGDDVFIVPADASTEPRMISQDGYETGWPRWSADGSMISFPSYAPNEDGVRKGALFVIPVDQVTGETGPQQKLDLGDFPHDVLQADWTADSQTLVFEAAEGAGKKGLYRVSREGGLPTRIHGWDSDQVHSGVGVSHDSRWVAIIAPDTQGFFQVFRVPMAGGEAEQLTWDPTQKTQPAYDPQGGRVAFSVFSYKAHFWALDR